MVGIEADSIVPRGGTQRRAPHWISHIRNPVSYRAPPCAHPSVPCYTDNFIIHSYLMPKTTTRSRSKTKPSKRAPAPVAPVVHTHHATHYPHGGFTLGTLLLIFVAVGALGAAYTGYMRLSAETRAANEARTARAVAERRAAEFETRVWALESEAMIKDVDAYADAAEPVTIFGRFTYTGSGVTFVPDPTESPEIVHRTVSERIALDPGAAGKLALSGTRTVTGRAVLTLKLLPVGTEDPNGTQRAMLETVLMQAVDR